VALTLTKKSNSGSSSAKLRGRLPSKKSINLVLVNKNKINLRIAIPAIILILGLAYLFGKYLVYDRIVAVDAARASVARLESTLATQQEALDQYSGVEEAYAHYTVDGMTEEELGMVDRTLVLDLISTVFSSAIKKESMTWTLSGNILTIELSARSLDALNKLARTIEESPIVDSCSITTANKSDKEEIVDNVKGKFVVYLHNPPETDAAVGEQAAGQTGGTTLEDVVNGAIDAALGDTVDSILGDSFAGEVTEP